MSEKWFASEKNEMDGRGRRSTYHHKTETAFDIRFPGKHLVVWKFKLI